LFAYARQRAVVEEGPAGLNNPPNGLHYFKMNENVSLLHDVVGSLAKLEVLESGLLTLVMSTDNEDPVRQLRRKNVVADR